MKNQNGWLKGGVLLVLIARPVVGLLRDRSFIFTVRPDSESSSGSESSFSALADAFEVQNKCEHGSIENFMLGKQGNCVPFVVISRYLSDEGGNVETASRAMFESTLALDSTVGDVSFYMNITDGSDNYSISKSTNPSHMYDEFMCPIQVLSLIQNRNLADANANDGKLDFRTLPEVDADPFDQDARALAVTAGSNVTSSGWEPAVAASISDRSS